MEEEEEMDVPEWAVEPGPRNPSRVPPPSFGRGFPFGAPGEARSSEKSFVEGPGSLRSASGDTTERRSDRLMYRSDRRRGRSSPSDRGSGVAEVSRRRMHSEGSTFEDRRPRSKHSPRETSYHPDEGHSVRGSHGSGRRRKRSSQSLRSEVAPESKIPKLGKTVGEAAAGAWAARFECADLLEAGLSRIGLIDLIRNGNEGPEPLKFDTQDMLDLGLGNRGYLEANLPESSKRPSEKSSAASVASSPKGGTEDVSLNEEVLAQRFGSSVKEQKAAYASYGASSSPGWARDSSAPSFTFSKRALPPHPSPSDPSADDDTEGGESEDESTAVTPNFEVKVDARPADEVSALFNKKARVPTPSEVGDPTPMEPVVKQSKYCSKWRHT